MSTPLKPGTLLVAQEDIVCAGTGEILIRRGSHMMYLQHISSSLRDFGHKVIDSSTLVKYILDAGVELVDADDMGTLYVVRPRFPDLPIHARRVREGVTQT